MVSAIALCEIGHHGKAADQLERIEAINEKIGSHYIDYLCQLIRAHVELTAAITQIRADGGGVPCCLKRLHPTVVMSICSISVTPAIVMSGALCYSVGKSKGILGIYLQLCI